MKRIAIKSFITLLLIVIIYYIIISLFVYPCKMEGMSMFPTTAPNEVKFTNRWKIITKQELNRGDIILFEKPNDLYVSEEEFDPNNLLARYDNNFNLNPFRTRILKRIVGVSGDYIHIAENNVIYVNGEFCGEANRSEEQGWYKYIDLVVPENSVYVMGDNRRFSTDSRSFGCIPIDKVYSVLF